MKAIPIEHFAAGYVSLHPEMLTAALLAGLADEQIHQVRVAMADDKRRETAYSVVFSSLGDVANLGS